MQPFALATEHAEPSGPPPRNRGGGSVRSSKHSQVSVRNRSFSGKASSQRASGVLISRSQSPPSRSPSKSKRTNQTRNKSQYQSSRHRACPACSARQTGRQNTNRQVNSGFSAEPVFSPLRVVKTPGCSDIYNMDLVNLRGALRDEKGENERLRQENDKLRHENDQVKAGYNSLIQANLELQDRIN